MPRGSTGAQRVTPVAPQAPVPSAGDVSTTTDWRRFGTMLGLVALPVFVLDQLVKLYIIRHLKLFEQIDLVPHWLAITYTLNSGAAFSLFASMPAAFRAVFFIILSFVAIVVLLALLARRSTPLVSAVAFALILGGTVGNLIDRLAHGKVVDFIYFHHRSFRYPVFNIADSAITVGVAIIVIFTSFGPAPHDSPPTSQRV